MRHFLIQSYKHAKFQQNRRWLAKEGCELTWNMSLFSFSFFVFDFTLLKFYVILILLHITLNFFCIDHHGDLLT